MAVLRLTQVIRRPVQDVFRTVADTGSFAAWNPTIKRSRPLSGGAAGEGSRAEWELRGFGTVLQELREFEPNRRLRIVPQVRSIAGGHRFTFTDLGTETRVDHEPQMTPKGIFKLMGPMLTLTGRRNLRATAAALQRHLEREWGMPLTMRRRMPTGLEHSLEVAEVAVGAHGRAPSAPCSLAAPTPASRWSRVDVTALPRFWRRVNLGDARS